MAGPAGLREGCAPGLPTRAHRAKQTQQMVHPKEAEHQLRAEPAWDWAPGLVGGSSLGPPALGALTGLPLPSSLPRLVSGAEGRRAPSPSRPQEDLLHMKVAGSWPGPAAHEGCRPEPNGLLTDTQQR